MSDKQTSSGNHQAEQAADQEFHLPPRTEEDKRQLAEIVFRRRENAHRELSKQ